MRTLRLVFSLLPLAVALPARAQAALLPFSMEMKQDMGIFEITSTRTLDCAGRNGEGGFEAGIFFGDSVSTPQQMRAALRRYADRFGAPPGLVKTFHSLEDDFSARGAAGRLLREILGHPGVTPLLSLEPTWHGLPPEGLLERIASGQVDDRLEKLARDLASADGTVLVELGAEMNARFGAPWQAERNGGEAAPAGFGRAWRHVVEVARASGASNVRWVFAPSAGNPYTHHPTGPSHWNWYGHWYPGDRYVDFLGLHAFNHAREQGAWVPFIELVTGDAADWMLDDMVARFPGRRVILGELATSEHPGRPEAKAEWIVDAYRRMRGCSAVAGAVWFDMDKETDWHLDSSPASAAGYASAVWADGVPQAPGSTSPEEESMP